MIAAIDAGHQRAEFAVGGLPAAEHDLVPGAAFGLGPALRAAGAIGRIELLGDDAFQRQLAGRFQHGIAAALEMLDIADQLLPCPCRASSSCFNRSLRSRSGSARRSSPSANSRSNAKKIRSSVLPSDSAACSAEKSGAPLWSSATISPSISASGSDARLLRDGAELVGPVQPLAGLQRRLAVLDPQLHAIAVELDLVAPAVAARRPLDRGAELRRDEIRHRRDLLRPCAALAPRLGSGSRACAVLPSRARFGRLAAVRMPDRVGFRLAALGQHERLWRLALALRRSASIDRPEATERSSSRMSLASPSLANSSRCLIRSQLVRLPP